MSAVANLLIEHRLGDTVPRNLRLKVKQKTGTVEPYPLSGSAVHIHVSGSPATITACTIVDAALGHITIPVGSLGLTIGNRDYSIVVTHPGGEIRTHTEGVIKTTARKGD